MTTLDTELNAYKANFLNNASEAAIGVIDHWVAGLAAGGIAGRVLQVGQLAPDFSLPNANGETVRLAELRASGPAVVTFYRGEWCPYCNLAVRAYQQALAEINSLGASLVAISPQTPDNSLTFQETAKLGYEVLSDRGNAVAREFGIVYRLGDEIFGLMSQFAVDLLKANDDDSRELPLPGTFVIGRDGVIRFAETYADHTQRADPARVIAALRGIR